MLCLYRGFLARGERVYIWGNIIDVILAFMRNGIVYFLLAGGVLKGGMSAAQFVLYFNTVNLFTGGIGKIMADLAILRKQSLDICGVAYTESPSQCFQAYKDICGSYKYL